MYNIYEHRRATAALPLPSQHRHAGCASFSRRHILAFNLSLTSPRQFCLPRTGLAKALGLGNVKLLGYYFAVLSDYRTAMALGYTHEKLHPGTASPPRRLPRSMTCYVPSLAAHEVHVKLIGYDFAVLLECRIVKPLSCTHDKHHLGSASPRRLPRSLTCCVRSLTACQTRSR